jgi:hypothetical protein
MRYFDRPMEPTRIAKSAAQGSLDLVVKATAQRLAPLGYKRSGLSFRLLRAPMAGLIVFQRSTSNTSECVKFTVNVGIVCGLLLNEGVDLSKQGVWDAHNRTRLGEIIHGDDEWWTIDSTTDVHQMAAEIAGRVCDHAVPYIERSMNSAALIALWESGASPGLTRGQARESLAKLKHIVATSPPG